jgi:hypothetical protein
MLAQVQKVQLFDLSWLGCEYHRWVEQKEATVMHRLYLLKQPGFFAFFFKTRAL